VPGGLDRREGIELGIAALVVAVVAVLHLAGANDVLVFFVAAAGLAALAREVGTATEQLGGRLGSGAAGVVQSALGNLPELFVALFALRQGLTSVVQSALVGSVLANSLLVLGLAFVVGGLKNGMQTFDSARARLTATLAALAAATLSIPALAHAFHSPAAKHDEALSLICAGVLLAVFVLTLGSFLGRGTEEQEPPRWSLPTTIVVLAAAAAGAVFVSDWFVDALTPAIETLHMSPEFAGLVIVAIAGNAVENVVGVQLAARNRPDFAISVVLNSALQVALLLTPVLVFASLLFATHLTLVFPTLLAVALVMAAAVAALITYDGESTWQEGTVLIGLYVVIASSFWWGT
jgi:Ca2+:H+ antiporter